MINCDHCGKVFKFDSQLLRHLSSKFPCYSRKPPEFVDNDNKGDVINKRECYEAEDMKRQDFVKGSEINVLILNALREGLIKTGTDAKTSLEELCKPVEENQCKKCSKVLCNKYYLQKHEESCNGLNSLQCPRCTKWFSSSSSKSIHMKNVKCSHLQTLQEHNEQMIEDPVLCKPTEKTKKHGCSICKKRFFNKKDWKSHESKCNGLDTLQCPTCHKYFCDSSSKSKHIKNVNCSPTPREPHNQSVYLIIEREFVKSSENIFKLGKTRTMVHRAKKYPNGSNILVVLPCADCDATEKKLLDVFRNTFQPRKDIGSEYFEGDPMSMIKTFMDTVDVCF